MVEETKRPLRRRRFGCILERKGSTGDVTSIEARYISPINGQRVSKRFAPGRRGDAEDWLETERSIVDLHRRGMMTWIPPRDRDGNTLTPKLTFGVFADGYVRRHRRKDGAEIAGSTLRRCCCGRRVRRAPRALLPCWRRTRSRCRFRPSRRLGRRIFRRSRPTNCTIYI